MQVKLAVVLMSALVLVACGGSSGDGDTRRAVTDRTLIADARQKTLDSETFRTSGRISINGTTFMELEGIGDFRTGASELTMAPSLSELDETRADLVVRIRGIDRENAYADFGGILTLPAGKRWVNITVDDAVDPEQFGGGGNPAAGLDFLDGVVERPRRVGTDTIRGVETTRYEVTVDLNEMLDRGATEAGRVDPVIERQLRRLLATIDRPTLDGAVWIDGDEQVTRFEYVLPDDVVGDVTTTFDYFDLGVPVEVIAPPPEEVVPYADVADQLSQLLTGVVPS